MNEEQERMLTAWNDPPASQAEEIAEARLWAAEEKLSETADAPEKKVFDYTPGPWKINQDATGIIIQSDEEYIAASSSSLANARLIAAAPDLLQALLECSRFMSDLYYESGSYDEAVRLLAKAIVAIDKAYEGEEPDERAEEGTP